MTTYLHASIENNDNQDQAEVDLLDDFDSMPDDIKAIMQRLSEIDECIYQEVSAAEKEANAIGYDFEWGLDGVPFNLRKKQAPQQG